MQFTSLILCCGMVLGSCLLVSPLIAQAEATPEDLIDQARQALLQRKYHEAVELATKAAEQQPDSDVPYVLRGLARQRLEDWDGSLKDLSRAIQLNPTAESHLIRGQTHSALDQHADAIADFTQALKLQPKLAAVHHHRGREYFKHGKVAESIADFDRYIELDPSHKNECWERGLSRYYAGQFKQAQESFEDYHKVGPGDIENGLWRMISQVKVEGLPAAQKDLLPYEPKRRPPFPLLYELFSGQTTPDQVLAHGADGAADEQDRTTRSFYTYLYVGLWHVASGDDAAARAILAKAVPLRSSDYMWYVARHHLQTLQGD